MIFPLILALLPAPVLGAGFVLKSIGKWPTKVSLENILDEIDDMDDSLVTANKAPGGPRRDDNPDLSPKQGNLGEKPTELSKTATIVAAPAEMPAKDTLSKTGTPETVPVLPLPEQEGVQADSLPENAGPAETDAGGKDYIHPNVATLRKSRWVFEGFWKTLGYMPLPEATTFKPTRYQLHVTAAVKAQMGGTPQRTSANVRVVKDMATRIMKEHGHRKTHIAMDLPYVELLCFTPSRAEMACAHLYDTQVRRWAETYAAYYPRGT